MPNGELLAIAEQTEPLGVPLTPGSAPASSRVSLNAAAHPRPVTPRERADPTDTMGLLGAVVGVLMLPFLVFIWLGRRREIRRLRARMDAGARRHADLVDALGGGPAPAASAAWPRDD
jgi:hypothetical protein